METSRPIPEAGILCYPGCQQSTVQGLSDLLRVASHRAQLCGLTPLRISHWMLDAAGDTVRIEDSHPGMAGEPTVVIVPGIFFGPPEKAVWAGYLPWLRARHAAGTTLAANCGGCFLLADAGLLDGRPATTHWCLAIAFQERFPKVALDTARILIDDGEIITAGGFMAWTDLGLRLIGRMLGPAMMLETARYTLIDPSGREQRFYSPFVPRIAHGDEAILRVQQWLQDMIGRQVSVAAMARQAPLEERTFLRRFKAATGMTPLEYVQHLKVGKARELLEFTRRSVEQIAFSVGYEDTGAFRRLFHRIVGLSPSEYRQRFTVQAAA